MTLEQILQRIGGYVDQDTSTPTGTDLTTRINYVNRALDEWASAYEWDELSDTYYPAVTLSATSIGLPSNFKNLIGPVYDVSKTSDNKYIKVTAEERHEKLSTDKYITQWGNRATGYYIEINPALASGASIAIDYQMFPSSLATLSDVAAIPNPDYLVTRGITYVLEARTDTRFPQVKYDADRLLQAMIEDEAVGSGAAENTVPDVYSSSNFRIGRE